MSTIEEQRAPEQLRSGIEEGRAAAAAVLAGGSGDEIDEALLELFGSAWERDNRDRARLISRMLVASDPDRDPACAERLLLESPAAGTPSRRARLEAWTMGEVPLADAAAFDVLLPALSDRRAAVYLNHLSRQRLVELLSDRKRAVRVHAAWTLYAFGDEAPIPPLTKTWIGDER